MAKKAKKAAKKVEVKLIEGKYSHKFLTRLEPQIGELLVKAQTHFKEKTLNGTIKCLITRFQPTMDELHETKKQLNVARQEMNKQATLLFGLKNNFKQLMDLKLIEVSFNDDEPDLNKCPEC